MMLPNLILRLATALLVLPHSALAFPVHVAPGETNTPAISDREQAGLRGPVRTCVDETSSPGAEASPRRSTTTEFDRLGRILSRTSESGTSRWIMKYSYAPDGTLQKVASGPAEGPLAESKYLYDSSGRLTSVVEDGPSSMQKVVQYDASGRRSDVRTFAAKHKNTAVAAHHDGTDPGFIVRTAALCEAMEACLTVKTLYNEHDRPREAELRDSDGRLMMRLIRTFDAHGNVVAERQAEENAELLVPAEIKKSEELNPAQIKAVGQLFAAMTAQTSSYVYDSSDRLIEIRSVTPITGQEVTTFSYNDHGDKVEERIMNSGTAGFSGSLNEQGIFFPNTPTGSTPPERRDTLRSYRYDEYGNWIEQKVQTRSKPDEQFRISQTIHRKLTYYTRAD
jgi:hypothetical protein